MNVQIDRPLEASSDLTNALSPRETEHHACADLGLEEKLRPLLREMLAGVRHHRDTTLLADFDGHGIVASALRSVPTWVPQTTLSLMQDMDTVKAIFNLVVKRTLQDQPDHPNARICLPPTEQCNGASATAGEPYSEEVTQRLAIWLEQFCDVMNDVHPNAIEVVILRVEGCDNRQIARRLGLTLRLVMRITHHIHRACECITKE